MHTRTNTRLRRGLFIERDIERLRTQHARLTPFLSPTHDSTLLAGFDVETERLLSEIFGDTSELLEAYDYASLGEGGALVNMPQEAQEGGAHSVDRESVQQRRRALESAIAELDSRRASIGKKHEKGTALVIGPQVSDYMSREIRSVPTNTTLKDAGRLLSELRIGSLMVADGKKYIGLITDTDLAREVVSQGLDPAGTVVASCCKKPPATIEHNQPMIQAVRLMKEHATRHLAVTENEEITGIISVSDVLRYYSGLA